MYKHVVCIFISMLLLSCGILLVASTEALAATSTYKKVLTKLENLTPGETIEVKIGIEKDRYDVGDWFEARFAASNDCYFALMHISVDGDITFLAPSVQVPSTRLEGGKVYSTGAKSPPESEDASKYDLGMGINVRLPHGIEILNLFCTSEEFKFFEADLEEEGFYMIKRDDEERLKSLLASLEQLEQHEWSGSSVKVIIGPPGVTTRAAPRKLGALPPIAASGTTGKLFPPIGSTGTFGKQ